MRHFMAITDAFFYDRYWRGNYCGNCDSFYGNKSFFTINYEDILSIIDEIFMIKFMMITDDMKYDGNWWEVL